MRIVDFEDIVDKVANLCIEVNTSLPQDVVSKMYQAVDAETSQLGKQILSILLDNIHIARRKHAPICQDTGIAVFFVELGEDVKIMGGTLEDAINEGVRQGYMKGYLRKSLISSPLGGENTNDNTPAVIYTKVVQGDGMLVKFLPKGAGSENASTIRMFTPTVQDNEIVDFVVKWVAEKGINACPPVCVGIGIGGTFEHAAILSKEALLSPIDEKNPDPRLAEMERHILDDLNSSGMGPQGLGGKTTAFAVHIKVYPSHIACLPVAINISCCAHRHGEITI